MIKISHLIVLAFTLLIASCSVYQNYFRVAKRANFKIAGQTAPPDMVFIQGNNEMESFYMSATEEPNINYVIYLKWLDAVYSESYPEVILDAYPKQFDNNKFLTYNDPYLQSYLTHPAFAYYPVTGLTWEQIQGYLTWKTDRLNEAILVKKGVLNFNSEQRDEDNFNTEAYLIGQYEGDLRKNLSDTIKYGERSVKFRDGILFTAFRLPTETEWEYANAAQNKSSGSVTYKGKKHPYHPYGDDYYTLDWGRTFSYRSDDYGAANIRKKAYYSYSVDAKNLENTNYQLPDAIKYDKTKQRMGNIPADYGLINMEGGAKEWLIDVYDENYEPEPDWKVVYQKSGYDVGLKVGIRMTEKVASMYNNKPSGDALFDTSTHVAKDSLGRMQFFRYMDVDKNGEPIEVGLSWKSYLKSKINISKKHRVVKGGTWEKPNNNRMSMRQDSAAVDVGFRCILPYTGLPVRKGYKVKW
jgi:formylglycine-generating enzyme required for sulfatase activity